MGRGRERKSGKPVGRGGRSDRPRSDPGGAPPPRKPRRKPTTEPGRPVRGKRQQPEAASPGATDKRRRRPEAGAAQPSKRPRPGREAAAQPPRSRAEHQPENVTPGQLATMLAKAGFPLTPPQLKQLAAYHAILLDRNRKLNLTRILNLEDMVLKHYVDCFLVARYIPDLPEPLLDIGSGAGFPDIPLKILFPNKHIILGEGVRKRVNFLREVREELTLTKLDIIGRNIDRDFEYPVHGTITRAVESVRETLRRVSNCLMPGGQAIFMKGPNVDQELEDAGKKYSGLFELDKDIAYTLPNSSYRRRLVIYRKVRREE